MKKRQSAVQKFSTFLSFSGIRSAPEWTTAPELERAIRSHLQDDVAELFALHCLSTLKSKTIEDAGSYPYLMAERHLSAYLQEACYQAAQKIQKQFRSVQHKYALEDLFQIGNLIVNQPAKLLQSYRSDYPYTSLESYARTAIFRFIGNTIYSQDAEAKREKFSDYGLLKDLSHKELREALAAQGLAVSQVESCCLARHCYSAVCQPKVKEGNRTLMAPSQADLSQIAICYNQHPLAASELKDGIAIQSMLSTCIQAARQYRSQRLLPIEHDDIIADPLPTPWETAIALEQREQIESLIANLFTTVPEVGQTLLKLWLGLGLTQSEIAVILKPKYPELQKQYQVARQLGKHNRNLLKAFLQQCQQLNPNLSLQDDQSISLIQTLLDECLQAYCRRLIFVYLERFTQQHSNETQNFIQAFARALEADLDLPPESLVFVNRKIAGMMIDWID